MNEADFKKLEQLVDDYGLSNIIEQLGAVCSEKANSANPGESISIDWENASHVLIRQFAEHRSIKAVSPNARIGFERVKPDECPDTERCVLRETMAYTHLLTYTQVFHSGILKGTSYRNSLPFCSEKDAQDYVLAINNPNRKDLGYTIQGFYSVSRIVSRET